jgi:hypothetical protein
MRPQSGPSSSAPTWTDLAEEIRSQKLSVGADAQFSGGADLTMFGRVTYSPPLPSPPNRSPYMWTPPVARPQARHVDGRNAPDSTDMTHANLLETFYVSIVDLSDTI